MKKKILCGLAALTLCACANPVYVPVGGGSLSTTYGNPTADAIAADHRFEDWNNAQTQRAFDQIRADSNANFDRMTAPGTYNNPIYVQQPWQP